MERNWKFLTVILLANDFVHKNLEEWKFESKLAQLGYAEQEIETIMDAAMKYVEIRR